MKNYNEKTIKSSEIFQILILHSLYSLKESKDVYFQGGTAIRWCYNGSRFSEDLDFV
jgi:predicted nucleotidyltransferase component of viral defense system